MKVAIIVVWLGKLPEYNTIWAQSIKFNPKLNWFLISDNNDSQTIDYFKTIPNIEYIYTTQNDIYNLIKKKCKIKIDKKYKAYKICDFRPLFGIIFDNILKGYDYWAYGDNDVIYGNLNEILEPYFIKNYDVIGTGQQNRCSGPLCFIKNTEKMNLLYNDLDPVLFKGKHNAVDEGAFSELVRNLAKLKKIKINLSEKEGNLKKEKFFWKKGIFYNYNNKKLNITHFHFGGGCGQKRRQKLRDNFIENCKKKRDYINEQTIIHIGGGKKQKLRKKNLENSEEDHINHLFFCS